MKKSLVLCILAALVTVPAATAKGPSAASIDGPGTGGGLSIGGNGESGGTPLGNLTMNAGFFQTTFGQQPDVTSRERPKGELGPRYRIVYTVPGPDNRVDQIRQDVYPYATPNPVTYMEPGQPFFGTERTHGGWYVAPPALKATLVAAGLPASAPATSAGGATFPAWSAGLIAFAAVLLLMLITAFVLRRRPRPAAAS